MEKQNRERKIQINFRVDENEYDYIKERMKHYGFTNMSLYLRKVAIRSKVEITDYSELNSVIDEMTAIGKNINQITARANATSRLYEEDIKEIKEQVKRIWQLLQSTLSEQH